RSCYWKIPTKLRSASWAEGRGNMLARSSRCRVACRRSALSDQSAWFRSLRTTLPQRRPVERRQQAGAVKPSTPEARRVGCAAWHSSSAAPADSDQSAGKDVVAPVATATAVLHRYAWFDLRSPQAAWPDRRILRAPASAG